MAMTGLVPTRTGDVHSQKSAETKPIQYGDIYSSLRGHSLFSECSDEFIHEMSDCMHMRTYNKGQIIVRKGDEGTNMYLIIIGSVRVGDESDELVYGTLSAGQFFGEMALLLNMRRTATVRANEFTVTLLLNKKDLQRTIQRYPDIGARLQREADERMQVRRMMATRGGSGLVERNVTRDDFLKEYVAKPISGVLVKVGLFQDLGETFLHDMSMNVTLKSFRAGEVVFREGDESDALYIILRGSVHIIVNDSVFAELSEGSFFGEIGMMMGKPRTATVRAATFIDTFVLSRELLETFIVKFPALRDKLSGEAHIRYNVVTDAARRHTATSSPSTKIARIDVTDTDESLKAQLQKISIFQNVNRLNPLLNDLAPVLEYHRYNHGDHIVTSGEISGKLYFLVLGTARVERDGVVISILEAGTFFGEVGIFIGVPRVASVVAIGNCACLELAREHVTAVLSKYPELYNQLKHVAESRYQAALRRERDTGARSHVSVSVEPSDEQLQMPVPSSSGVAPLITSDIRNIESINDLDPDLLTKIFNRCDALTKIQISRVCRYWHVVLRSVVSCLNYSACKKQTTDDVVVEHMTGCGAHVKDIVLNDCFDISDVALQAIANHCPHLRSLELGSCWKVTNTGLLAIASQCSEIMVVNLTNCFSVGDDGVSALVESNPSIIILGLGFCKRITDSAIHHVSRSLHHLTVLDLNRCEAVSIQGFKQVSLGVLSELRVVRLAHCINVEADVLSLMAEGCPHLQYLDVSFCQRLTSQSLTVLAEKLKKLRVLICNYIPAINDKTVSILCSELPVLNHLSIKGSDITMESIHLLVHVVNLSTIELTGCKNIDMNVSRTLLGNRMVV